MRLAAGQYYVLGDNSPVSEDSRRWPTGEVNAKLLVGKPLVVVTPARLSLGGRGFSSSASGTNPLYLVKGEIKLKSQRNGDRRVRKLAGLVGATVVLFPQEWQCNCHPNAPG